MANTRSAKKHIRADEKKRIRNLMIRSKLKTLIRRAERSIAATDPATVESVRPACAELDNAASKGVIHRNNAARRKSRLMAKFNKTNAA